MNNDEQFFYDNAGYSWNPLRDEDQEAGHVRCAIALAKAEKVAKEAGVTFEWEVDMDTDSSEWRDDVNPYATWNCVAQDKTGEVFASLCGIDFGLGGSPWKSDYARVVETELALEYEPPIVLEVTYIDGSYLVKDGTRKTYYRAEGLNETTTHYEGQIKRTKRALKDLKAIAKYINDEVAKAHIFDSI